MYSDKELIRAEAVTKSFGEGDEKRNVLDGVTAAVHEGEFVSVMGPSGSGKSTLLFAMSGMDGIDGGKISFAGRELTAYGENEMADLRRTQMGFVFQQPTMLKNLNILENIIFPSMRDNRKNVDKITARARELMEMTGIAELEKRSVTQASGGQLQRAGICRALLCGPKIVFGDEPTGALNSQSAQEIMDILSQINAQGTAVMLVTHDPKVAARSERVLFLCDGTVVKELKMAKYTGGSLTGRVDKVLESMRGAGI